MKRFGFRGLLFVKNIIEAGRKRGSYRDVGAVLQRWPVDLRTLDCNPIYIRVNPI